MSDRVNIEWTLKATNTDGSPFGELHGVKYQDLVTLQKGGVGFLGQLVQLGEAKALEKARAVPDQAAKAK